ncbi:hypothetical protein [Cryobacterium sp. GrIS_2_6]|uniref:hypothetical protein n=1 Tax=Cryobacterium sp. GrIS_2_6 TaxID=3162785 RepID=UPI002E0B4444|nr:hypothetical protein [Cryobacterium psychrotolerans]
MTAARFRAIKRAIRSQAETNYYNPNSIARQHGTSEATVNNISELKNWAAYEAQKHAAQARQKQLGINKDFSNYGPTVTAEKTLQQKIEAHNEKRIQMMIDDHEAEMDKPMTQRQMLEFEKQLNERISVQNQLIAAKANKRKMFWSRG